jgi:hypothetical protein
MDLRRVIAVALSLILAAILAAGAAPDGRQALWSRGKLIHWPYYPGDSSKLKSITLAFGKSDEWKTWAERGVATGTPLTWHSILTNTTVEQGAAAILGLDFGGNPAPIACIDEFGFDYGGATDRKSADVLLEARRRRPDLGLLVYHMRGPFNDVLADAYRRAADAVALECYAKPGEYWWILTQVLAARMNRVMDKSIVLLGLGTGGQPDESWPSTKDEVERQVRFVRLIAPESKGIGFFAGKVDPEVVGFADDLCSRFFDLPTDGTGVPAEAVDLVKKLTGPHDAPFLVCAPAWVQPDRSYPDPGVLIHPVVFRALVMNLGDKDVKGVRFRLRNTPDNGGAVFAEGIAEVLPAHKVSVALLPVIGEGSPWKNWLDWVLEVEAPGCEVVQFP